MRRISRFLGRTAVMHKSKKQMINKSHSESMIEKDMITHLNIFEIFLQFRELWRNLCLLSLTSRGTLLFLQPPYPSFNLSSLWTLQNWKLVHTFNNFHLPYYHIMKLYKEWGHFNQWTNSSFLIQHILTEKLDPSIPQKYFTLDS